MMSLYIFILLLTHLGFSCCCPAGVNCTVSNDVFCEISQSSSYSLRDIEACFSGNYQNALVIAKNSSGQVVINIDSKIGSKTFLLSFINLSPQGKFIIRASMSNADVRTIYFTKNGFHIDEADFFDRFHLVVGITTYKAYLTFDFRPSFSKLTFLEVLEITVSDPKEELTVLTADMLQDTSIQRFRWSGSLKSIEPTALHSLRNLTKLDLTANFLTTLPDVCSI